MIPATFRPRPAAQPKAPGEGQRLYGIGILREADAVGMVDGPNPSLTAMLDTVPLADWTEGGEVAIFRFVGHSTEEIFRWAEGDGWKQVSALQPSEESEVARGRQPEGDPAVADARDLAAKWRQVVPLLGNSRKLTALAEQTAVALEEMAARLEADGPAGPAPGMR
jgi:hypothetical protein